MRSVENGDRNTASAAPAAVVKTTKVGALGTQLAALRAAQEKHHAPKWWARFANHPVKSAVAAVLLVFLILIGAIGGPLAWRSYTAYKQIFNTPVPQVGNVLEYALNDQGTPYLVGISETTVAEVPDWDGTSRITILLMGVDRREDEPSRSDTMILVNIDPVAKTARMVSIPRDLRVFVPGKGVYKINAAYALGDYDKKVPGGGPGLTMRTIEANFGIDINYYAEIDFDGFTKIVDTVGGITLDVPYPIKDNEYPGPANQYMRIYFPAGWQHMDGEQVLQYARTRHDDSDLYRSRRQQQILLALRQQAVSLDLINKAPQLIDDFGDAVGTDLSPSQAVKLARLASEIGPDNIEQLSLDSALTATRIPSITLPPIGKLSARS
jgi:LCP family protein required for cell wall assembly